MLQTQVYHNHGRWVARCPHCNNAWQVIPGVDRVCVCREPGCPVAGVGQALIWPAPEMVVQVERVLTARPLERTRNWLPHETVARLEAENREHGL